jgi:hypothetical protein
LIARNHGHIEKAFIGTSVVDLQKELQALENELGILQRLSALKTFKDEDRLQQHNVLNIVRDENGDLSLVVLPFKKAADAIAKATELELSESSVNAVYVRADNPKQLRSAYRNYFNDPIDFVEIIRHEGDVEERQ